MNFNIVGKRTRPIVVDKMIKFLDSMKDGDLLSSPEFCNKARIPEGSAERYFRREELKKYRHGSSTGVTYLWGNPKTIKEYIKYAKSI